MTSGQLRQVALPAGPLRVFEAGDGDPLLFVHAFPLDHRVWSNQLEYFSRSFRVIAPDLRGFGQSPAPAREAIHTMEQFADDCAAVLEALDCPRPVTLCGLSLGGYIAWQFARKHMGRLRSLVLCDARAAADTPDAAETRLKMARHVLEAGNEAVVRAMLPKVLSPRTVAERPDVVNQVETMMRDGSPSGIAAAQRGMAARPDARELLPRIAVPALVVVGSDDAVSPPAEMREIARQLPAARFEEIEDAGHLSPLENPSEVNAAIEQFLRST